MGKADAKGGLPSAPAGQPGDVSGAAPVPMAQVTSEQQGGATTPTVSDDVVLGALEKAVTSGKLDGYLERFYQSRADRQATRIQKIIEAAKAKGVEITPEVAEQIGASLAEDTKPTASATMPAAPSPTGAPAQAPVAGGLPDPATATATWWMNEDGVPDAERVPATVEAYRMMATANTRLVEGDVEISGIVVDKGQNAYLQSVQAAIAAKQNRLSKQGDPSHVPALSGATPSGRPAHEGMSGLDTLTMGLQDLRSKFAP